MKVVDKLEDVFYGQGIQKTHIISETDFETVETFSWGNELIPAQKSKLVNLPKTLCGYSIQSFLNKEFRDEDYNINELKKIVTCKKCLKKIKGD